MHPLKRLQLLAFLALLGATPVLAQEDAGDDPDSTAAQTDMMSGIDWSVGLRGSYAANTLTGGKPSLSLTPEVSLVLEGESGQTIYGSGAEIIVDASKQARIADLHAGIEHSYKFSASTLLEGSINGQLTQADRDSSDLPVNTLYAPIVFDGATQASITQDMGRFDGKLTLDGHRQMRTATTLEDLSTIDNSNLNYWQGGATLRLGYELSPVLSTFIEGEFSAQKFDAVDPTLLVYLDGRRYELRGGVSYAKGSIVSAEASVGRAWLNYFDASLTDQQSWVYNANVTVRPDETLSLTGALDTTLGPSESVAGDTDAAYTLTGAANYQVNPWITLRGSANWDYTITLGTGDIASGYGFGVGLDYRSSRHIVWTADYNFDRENAPPTPQNDTHTVMLGVRVTR